MRQRATLLGLATAAALVLGCATASADDKDDARARAEELKREDMPLEAARVLAETGMELKNVELLREAAVIHLQHKRYGEAAELTEQALRLAPDDATTRALADRVRATIEEAARERAQHRAEEAALAEQRARDEEYGRRDPRGPLARGPGPRGPRSPR